MEEKIKEIYDLLRKVIIENKEIEEEIPNIYNFFSNNVALHSRAIKDENILKLSVIYRYSSLGRINWSEKEDCKKITKSHSELSNKGSKYYGISLHELGLLAEEVVEQNEKYSKLVEEIEHYKNEYNNSSSIEDLNKLIDTNFQLRRLPEALEFINKIKKYLEKQPSAIYDYLIQKANYFLNLEKDILISRERKNNLDKYDLEELLKIFQEKNEENKLFGIYDYSHYLSTWTSILRLFFKQKSINGKYFPEKEIKSEEEVKGYVYKNYKINSDEEVKRIIKFLKQYDFLILESVKISNMPHFYSMPIFNGTYLLIIRTLLNLSFPEKYETLLNILKNLYRDRKKYKFINLSLLENRLLIEFPRKRFITNLEIISCQYRWCHIDKIKAKQNIQKLKSIAKIIANKDISSFGKAIELIVKYHILLDETTEAKRISLNFIKNKNIQILEYNLYNIINAFYKAKKYPEFIELVNIVLMMRGKNKINIGSGFLKKLAEAYVKINENKKIDSILSYYQENKFNIDLQYTLYRKEYEDILKIKNSLYRE